MKKLFTLLLSIGLSVCALAQEDKPQEDMSQYVVSFPKGWATFNSPDAVTVPEGVNVYTVTVTKAGDNDEADYIANVDLVTLPEATIEGKNERYIPKAPSGMNPVLMEYNRAVTLNKIEEDPDDPHYTSSLYEGSDSPDGELIGTENPPDPSTGITISSDEWYYKANEEGDYHTYALGFTDTLGLAFYEVEPGKNLPANRAFIEIYVPGAHSAPRFKVKFTDSEDMTDNIAGVETLTESKADNAIYDLMGRKVTSPQRGQIYIKNNHKYIQQ